MQHLAVIGGGISGVTTAYALVRRGFDVTLFDRRRYAGMETSFANGGQLSASNAEVWNHWPTVLKGMKWMFRSDAPLLVNPKPSWHKLSWFMEFLAAIPQHESNTIATTRLAIAAREHLYAWADEEQIDFDLKRRGIMHIHRSAKDFKHAQAVNKLLAQGGLERRVITPGEMRSIEPTLTGDFHGGFFTESDATGDIHKYTHGLAEAAVRRGVTIHYEHDVTRIGSNGQRSVVTSRHAGQTLDNTFDGIVICAGTASRRFARQLGDRVNIYPVKGYSITVNLDDEKSRHAAPQVSMLDDETKLVSSRLGDGRFRVAGTAEYNGFNRDIRAGRIRPLVEWVQQLFPHVSTQNVVPWAGLRPMMPNMMPYVGPGRRPNVFYNTGHGHLGWTLSAGTADAIAGIVESAAQEKSPGVVTT